MRDGRPAEDFDAYKDMKYNNLEGVDSYHERLFEVCILHSESMYESIQYNLME